MTVSTPLRVGVIGVGHLGRHHARLLKTLEGVKLAGVADHSLDRAKTAAEGTQAKVSTKGRDLLGSVDAVVVAVPTVDHLSVARPFLERGIHVLVEKPMAPSVAEAEELIALASASDAVLAVGHSERFNPAVVVALPMIQKPRFIEVHRLSAFPERSLDVDVIFDVMIHDLDIILAVDGSVVTSVEAIGVAVLTPKIDICNARVKFESGAIANITASRISRETVRKIRFFQPDLYVSVDYAAQALEAFRLRHRPGDRPAIEGGPVTVSKDEPLRLELADFVDAIRVKRAPAVTGQAGLLALALATRVAQAVEITAPPVAKDL